MNATAGAMLELDDSAAFAALVETMDSLGCRFVVHGSDDISYDGPPMPAWCGDVAGVWFDLIVDAHLGRVTKHHLYACADCGMPMLLATRRKGRGCPACGAVKSMTRLPIRFAEKGTSR